MARLLCWVFPVLEYAHIGWRGPRWAWNRLNKQIRSNLVRHQAWTNGHCIHTLATLYTIRLTLFTILSILALYSPSDQGLRQRWILQTQNHRNPPEAKPSMPVIFTLQARIMSNAWALRSVTNTTGLPTYVLPDLAWFCIQVVDTHLSLLLESVRLGLAGSSDKLNSIPDLQQ